MRTLILISLLSAVLGTSIPVREDRDGSEYSISVDVNVALFNVTVTDRNGRHVPGLKATDFRVIEDGRAQEIRIFNAEDVPATIGLVVDNSGSMRTKRNDVQRAAFSFLRASNPADELFLVNFNERVSMGLPEGLPFTSDFGKFQFALSHATPGGMTALYDAIALGLGHIQTGSHSRKAVIVLSDGGDNVSRLTLKDVLELARRSNATIYTIGIFDREDPDRNPRVLRKFAQSGGGRAYFPESLAHLDQAWREIAGEIRSQYTIGYVPTRSGHTASYRSVKIIATQKDGNPLKVATRDGYVLPGN